MTDIKTNLSNDVSPKIAMNRIDSPTTGEVSIGHTISGHCTHNIGCPRLIGFLDFTVPKTRGFLEYFRQGRLNFGDVITATSLSFGMALLWSGKVPKMVFLVIFIFWRLVYNVGLGYILRRQGNNEWFTELVRGVLKTKSTLVQIMLKPAIMAKMDKDYSFQSMPVEYNAWLVFRIVVDLILFHDFNGYVLFAIAYNESTVKDWADMIRVIAGISIVAFNWWVKSDAHRVVKDYAWYWGDFFFFLDGSLTFDGVFELAPHPMYSLGYVWYYGVSLICKSYVIFFVGLAAHVLQLAFLVIVETPHMDKIYGTTPSIEIEQQNLYMGKTPVFHRDMVLFFGFDLRKATDMMTLLFMGSSLLVHVMGSFTIWMVVLEFLFWRAVFCGILGYVLYREDRDHAWTKHYIKWGYSATDAFNNWKALYNFSLVMNYTMFLIVAAYTYRIPTDWTVHGMVLRHTLGLLMIVLQCWTSYSIFEGLGEFGWFYGDFFYFNQEESAVFAPTLSYTGIYRYLNNPEKIVGQAAYFGLALICYDSWMVALACIALFTNYAFLEWVERPHMIHVYGERIRKESGLSKTVKKLPGARSVVQAGGVVVEQIEKALEKNARTLEEPVIRIVDNVKGLVTNRLRRRATSLPSTNFSFETDRAVYEIGDHIRFSYGGEEIGTKIVFLWCRRLTHELSFKDCEPINDLYIIESGRVPWMSGTFKLAIITEDGRFLASPPFEITSPEGKNDVESCLVNLLKKLGLKFESILPLGSRNPIFKRLSEAIFSLYGVDFAPATVFQFATSSKMLSEQVTSARSSLIR